MRMCSMAADKIERLDSERTTLRQGLVNLGGLLKDADLPADDRIMNAVTIVNVTLGLSKALSQGDPS